ncbi:MULTISPECIES: sigma-54 interaction domain-containing protein [Bacillus]|uniref:HTH-type transcriptional regulatory protein TyrR n=1 Tax=Bacillus cereus (strain ATCC 14579 / DSM 31 / CCUG 7414 / JCM 2152 / NBRC 15305 / NCIMB 9373 / NCTC 2599 / NRRL B-3711) TaxID=226900 RepID=Q81IM8_BACCR|nr:MULTISPECIES: sigma 54-interacting transcriptional regulator [Bacillus]AAP07396.1 Sigma-54-dependent transcriptional activator [Bacillus cereus ATCC 14579]KZD77885.1 sensory box sigma-54 dependent DNA-binding response regulator in GABA cluster [Bacillus cereus]MCC2455851.1 sigma 54-interacting transcriptional regulator [Bacillus cereus]MCC3287832.1 sigma 54-interacting transcriptional regulator [Bacillus cereus]MDZ4480780.1 sigma 54-interacting transcriptional regulator [Bacillus cereus]
MVAEKERVLMDLKDVFEYAFDEIFVTDEQGIVVRVNSTCERHYQLAAEELVGKHVKELQKDGIFYPSATLEVIEKKRPIELVQTTKSGEYLHVRTRPVFDDEGNLRRVISYSRDLTELYQLRQKVEEMDNQLKTYKKELRETYEHEGLIFKSLAMQKIVDTIKKVSVVDSTVLVLGETGVGKSRLVRHLHEVSHRKHESFYEINCAALPTNLIESELFGYSGGSFTGANREGKKGLLESAHKGTLFLDEIGEMPLEIQAKLLQVLQEKTFRPIGGRELKKVDVRIVAATNRDLSEMVKEGTFRKDLYYRLNVIPIAIPPLRERTEDILPLIYHYLQHFNKKYGRDVKLAPSTLQMFVGYPWEGNNREIENVIERIVITVDDVVTVEDLPLSMQEAAVEQSGQSLYKMLEEVERNIILKAYKTYGSSYKVAEFLQISQSAATRKIKKFIEEEENIG